MLPTTWPNRRNMQLWVEEGQGHASPPYPLVTIGSLPDDILLEIFDFVRQVPEDEDWDSGFGKLVDRVCTAWQTLVQVCRRWRHVVYASPHRLNLQLPCRTATPVRKLLDVWPTLPLIVSHHTLELNSEMSVDVLQRVDNIMAVLGHNDRVRAIELYRVQRSLWERFAEVLQRPFPALTHLRLRSADDNSVPALPDSLLGGYAPRLRTLVVDAIPNPVLRKLPPTCPNLVNLHLRKISYISPKEMVNCLSGLSKLKRLELGFHSPQPRPDQTSRQPPPLNRVVLPTLTSFYFKGVSEYLEDLVAQVNIPLLRDSEFRLAISCTQADWNLSSVAQVCSSLHPLSALSQDLDILSEYWLDDNIDNTQWLELLHPFINVKRLTVSEEDALYVAQALGELPEERVAEVMPALDAFCTHPSSDAGPPRDVQEALRQFVITRELSGHPVAVSSWDRLSP